MNILANQGHYILKSNLDTAGIPAERHDDFIAAYFAQLKARKNAPLPDKTLNIKHRLQILALNRGTTLQRAKEALIDNPSLLFEKDAPIRALAGNKPNDAHPRGTLSTAFKILERGFLGHPPKPDMGQAITAPYPPWTTGQLASLLHAASEYVQINKPLRNQPAYPTIEDILDSAHLAVEHEGKRPTKESGLIRHGKMADGITTWRMVDERFAKGTHGLKNCGYTSLSACMNAHKVERRKYFLLSDIEESARATVDATGRRPTCHDKEIKYGPLKGLTTWWAIDSGFMKCPERFEDYISLASFLDDAGIKNPAVQREKTVIQARVVFKDIADHAMKGVVPKNKEKGVVIAGKSVAYLNDDFRHGRIDGLEEFTPQQETLTTLSFAEASGLAKREGGKLVPAPAKEIRRLLKEHGLS